MDTSSTPSEIEGAARNFLPARDPLRRGIFRVNAAGNVEFIATSALRSAVDYAPSREKERDEERKGGAESAVFRYARVLHEREERTVIAKSMDFRANVKKNSWKLYLSREEKCG